MLTSGELQRTDLCWCEGMPEWRPLQLQLTMPASLPPPLPSSPPPPPIYATSTMPAERPENSLGMRMMLPVGRSAWAIIAGYLGLFSVVVLPAPFALVCSILAISDIRKSSSTANPKYGMGRAIFGLIMGIIGTCVLCFILFQVATKK